MRYGLKGADKSSGAQRVVQVEADSLDEAILAGREAGVSPYLVGPIPSPVAPGLDLKGCDSCKNLISARASKCPNCGKSQPISAKKALAVIASIAAATLLLIFLAFWLGSHNGEARPSQTTSAGDYRQNKINELFNKWDGSLPNLVERVKSSMNDPASFTHVETKYDDKEDHLLVIMTYRGKNAFGGVLTKKVAATVSLNGSVKEIVAAD